MSEVGKSTSFSFRCEQKSWKSAKYHAVIKSINQTEIPMEVVRFPESFRSDLQKSLAKLSENLGQAECL